ncbi:hypothetical protein B0A52_08685 [Exophiala mesophila]|uniref:Uncharacterized protein n=1 Tax=Exophiala mesophila TaxID=212818 RepID=A0A438MWP1_EXOME|nr:hypothetical protein B0A52_08685 [Exophiala mesophila]
MARDKENNPLPSSPQSRGPVASLTRHLPSDDFFTDSVLENSSIPSPSPHKLPQVKPRRAVASKVLQAARNPPNLHKARPSGLPTLSSNPNRHLQTTSSPPRKKSPSRLITNGFSTPPRSKSLSTPADFSSPPGGISDVYERIEAEEDLAATEREPDSDQDDMIDDLQYTSELDVDLPPHTNDTNTDALQLPPPPDPTAPSENLPDDDKENDTNDPRESLSEHTTLDFLKNEMTDRVLAAKLTPRVVDRAKDKARLEKLKQSHIPIDFRANGSRSNGATPNGRLSERNTLPGLSRGPVSFNVAQNSRSVGLSKTLSNTSEESTPQKKIRAFSKATKPFMERYGASDDDNELPPARQTKVKAFSKASWPVRQHEDDQLPEDNLPDYVPRLVAFSRADRPSSHIRSHSEEPPNNHHDEPRPEDTVTSVGSEPLPSANPRSPENIAMSRSFLAKWRQSAAERRTEKAESIASDDGSQVDWLAASADVPLPSVEDSITPREKPKFSWSASAKTAQSLDKNRKWENDFTGLSFQVSESPPVKSRPQLIESPREKEIERLAQQGVTTSRLGEIQQKDPNVLVRKSSRSFTPEEKRHTPARADEKNPGMQIDKDSQPEKQPESPAGVPLSSDNISDRLKSSQRQSSGSSSSLEHLQRLARAVSTTPKGSPPSQDKFDDLLRSGDKDQPSDKFGADRTKPNSSPNGMKGTRNPIVPVVAETPRVAGAWTDTILPDTVKPQNQKVKAPIFAQTPQVNAGGWIDTPLPGDDRLPPIPIPTIIEEETEELSNVVLANSENEERGHEEETKALEPEVAAPTETNGNDAEPISEKLVQIPRSALSNILEKQKQKRLEPSENVEGKDDTFNLGDATIQSIEDFMVDAADLTADLTTRIRAGAQDEVDRLRQESGDSDNTEVFLASQLTSRMERLMTNLHEARKGISRLEQKVSHPSGDEMVLLHGSSIQTTIQLCSVCGQNTEPHSHNFSKLNSWVPMAYSVAIISVPLLFYPRRKDRHQTLQWLPRPTPLGWLTIVGWIWLLLEFSMCELYSHPTYADYYVWPTESEPEFPMVLATMIYRWTRFDRLAPGVWRILVGFYRMIGMLVGFSDGFVDEPHRRGISRNHGGGSGAMEILADATNAAYQAVKSIVPSAALNGVGDGAAPDLSMMSDEFI